LVLTKVHLTVKMHIG